MREARQRDQFNLSELNFCSHQLRRLPLSPVAGDNGLTIGKRLVVSARQCRGLLLMRSPRIEYLLGAARPLAFPLVAHHATQYRRAIASRRPLPDAHSAPDHRASG